jgi:hypothetical protein
MTQEETETEAKNNILIAQRAFIWSLGIGTALMFVFLISEWDMLLIIGFLYVVIAILFNLIVFLNNIIFLTIHRERRLTLLLNTLLLLLNIPIAILYLSILFNH